MVGEAAKGGLLAARVLRERGFVVSGGAEGRSAVTTVEMHSEAAATALLDAVQASSCIGAHRAASKRAPRVLAAVLGQRQPR